MKFAQLIGVICLGCCSSASVAQDTQPSSNIDQNPVLKHRPPENSEIPQRIVTENIELTVPKGSALEVVIDRETRVRGVGQPIHGHLIEPVYTFDKLVLPVGTEVNGRISQMEVVSASRRALSALDANLSPFRQITIEFTELSLADGKQIPIQTTVAPGSGQVIRFVTAAESKDKKSAKDVVSEKERQVRQEARRQFDSAMQQMKKPGRLHRLQRYAVAQLPIHPQYIDAGAVYFAELVKPLEFGNEPLTPEIAASMNSELPEGTMVHAQLMTSLNSASLQKGAGVQAIVSRPLVDDGKLILPQGSLLKGSVVQVQPAQHWKHNGQLRFVFRELRLPNGVESKVKAVMQGVQSPTADNLQLDAEGGADTKTPKTRYLRSGIAIGLAAATHEDEPLNRAEGGAGGFRMIGMVVGATVHSQPLAIAMGAIGVSRSIYNNFIARGTDVVFAKHTAVEIGVDTRGSVPRQSADPVSNNSSH